VQFVQVPLLLPLQPLLKLPLKLPQEEQRV